MKRMIPLLLVVLASGCTEGFASSNPVDSHRVLASGDEHHDDHDGDHDDDHDTASANVTPAQAAHVVILHDELIGRPTEVLGTVDVHTSGEAEETALAQLRMRGAALGADAVVGVEFHHGATGPTHLSGMAVRYRDLLDGRTFDVIGHLDVRTPMGHDHHALEALRSQARALHADLIVNIRYVHGDDEHGPTELLGDAIRYR